MPVDGIGTCRLADTSLPQTDCDEPGSTEFEFAAHCRDKRFASIEILKAISGRGLWRGLETNVEEHRKVFLGAATTTTKRWNHGLTRINTD